MSDETFGEVVERLKRERPDEYRERVMGGFPEYLLPRLKTVEERFWEIVADPRNPITAADYDWWMEASDRVTAETIARRLVTGEKFWE